MKLTTFMQEILPNLPHLMQPSSEPGSSVHYPFWTLGNGCTIFLFRCMLATFLYVMFNNVFLQLSTPFFGAQLDKTLSQLNTCITPFMFYPTVILPISQILNNLSCHTISQRDFWQEEKIRFRKYNQNHVMSIQLSNTIILHDRQESLNSICFDRLFRVLLKF